MTSNKQHHPADSFGCALFFVSFALLLAGCGGSSTRKQPAVEAVSGLHVQTVHLESVPDEIEAPGTVASVETALVAARTMGTIEQVLVREGDRVRRGQLLVLLDEREPAARRAAAESALREAGADREEAAHSIAAAKAQADVANKTHERFVYLREQKSVSAQEFDEVEAKQRVSQALFDQAQARLVQAEAGYARAQQEARVAETVAGYTHIVAPFDGLVVRRNVEPGSMAAPGILLLVVESASRYRLEVTLDVADAIWARRGAGARVRLDALPDREFAATVSELEAGANPNSHTVLARIDLPADAAVRSGLFGRAWFRRGDRSAFTIPAQASLERGQLRGVYALDPSGIARLRLVTLGPTLGERAEVLSGLSDGERIVTDPEGRDLNGKRVEGNR
jgi:RND family efflux transporter MFP subunit